MIIDRRFRLFGQWLAGRRNGVGAAELFRHLLAPLSRAKAQKFIVSLEEAGEYYVTHFQGMAAPLYHPRAAGLSSLYQVASEIFDTADWHHYEIPETAIRSEDIVADCGAAEGLFSLKAAKQCKKVYAIEPLPLFIRSLHKTFDALPNVEIVPAALGAVTGGAYLSDDGIMSVISERPTATPVQVTTIDELFVKQGRPLTYLKADLEGYELEMLEGARETIRANRPRVAITTYHQADHAARIERLLLAIHPDYHILVKGIEERAGAPVMLHAW